MKHTDIAAPHSRETNPESIVQEDAVDVVVVGAGAAGLAAAASAAGTGTQVTVLEKLSGLWGTTSKAVGSVSAAGTRLQRIAGVEDDADAFAEDIALANEPVLEPEHLRRLLAQEAGPTIAWLERLGVVFVGPFPEPPNRVPRMLNAVPGARIYLQALHKEAVRLGASVRFDCAVTDLVRSGDEVVGVRYRSGGATRELHARGGVVLASGDFTGSREMRERFLPPPAAAAIPVNEHSTGDGHRMAMDAGADMKCMDLIIGPQLRLPPQATSPWFEALPTWRWLRVLAAAYITHAPKSLLAPIAKRLLIAHMSPAPALFEAGAVLVDDTGRRLGEKMRPIDELALTPSRSGYVIGDQRIARQFSRFPWFISTAPGVAFAYFRDYERGRPDLVRWADDAPSLAQSLKLDAAKLSAATAHLSPPFFALGQVKAMITVCEGGAAVDSNCRVLDKQGRPIPGLYAAGGVGQSGLQLKGHGLHLVWALISGRVAGQSAAVNKSQHKTF
jgi:fumarate reductase flavoprotein subunit